RPEIIKLHHSSNFNLNNRFVQWLLQHPQIFAVHHDTEEFSRRINSTHYAHLADIIRLDVLLKDGGIYLDSDVFALHSFSTLRHSPLDVILGNEGGNRNGLCNAVILSRPNATFIRRWID